MSEPVFPRVFILSGPSGVGKSTIIKRVLAEVPNLRLSVSLTTREPRSGEVDGRDYTFVPRERFERMIEEGRFLEWARVFDNYYGTAKSQVQATLDADCHVLLDVDTQGALQIQEVTAGAVYVFIRPPSLEALRERLTGRNTETPEVLAKRLARAEHEIGLSHHYDHVIVNDDLERAVAECLAIVREEERRPVVFTFASDVEEQAARAAARETRAAAAAAPEALRPGGSPGEAVEALRARLVRAQQRLLEERLTIARAAALPAEIAALVQERLEQVVRRELPRLVEDAYRARQR